MCVSIPLSILCVTCWNTKLQCFLYFHSEPDLARHRTLLHKHSPAHSTFHALTVTHRGCSNVPLLLKAPARYSLYFFLLSAVSPQFTPVHCSLTWSAAWPGSVWMQYVGWTLACPSSGSCSSHPALLSVGTGHFMEHSGISRFKNHLASTLTQEHPHLLTCCCGFSLIL